MPRGADCAWEAGYSSSEEWERGHRGANEWPPSLLAHTTTPDCLEFLSHSLDLKRPNHHWPDTGGRIYGKLQVLVKSTFQKATPPHSCDKYVKDAIMCDLVDHTLLHLPHAEWPYFQLLRHNSSNWLTCWVDSKTKTPYCCYWWNTVSCKMRCSHQGKITILNHQMTEELFFLCHNLIMVTS